MKRGRIFSWGTLLALVIGGACGSRSQLIVGLDGGANPDGDSGAFSAEMPDTGKVPSDAIPTVEVDSGGGPGDANQGLGVDSGALEQECPHLEVPIHVDVAGPVTLPNGVEVTPLQIPSLSSYQRSQQGGGPWDSSEIPAGACVFRMKGVKPSCYVHTNSFMVGGPCAHGKVSARPVAFYERHQCGGVAPGCTLGEDTYWWYLSPAGDDQIDLVICLAQCAGSVAPGGACLELNTPPSSAPTCP